MQIQSGFLCFLLTFLLATSCGNAQEPGAAPQDSPVVTWDQVRAVFQKRCFACHRGEQARGGLDLSSVAAIRAGATSGASVVPFKPEESLIYTLPAHLENPKMPPNGTRLPQRELNLIQQWILGGLSEKTSPPEAGTAPSEQSTARRPLARPITPPRSIPPQPATRIAVTNSRTIAGTTPLSAPNSPTKPVFASPVRHQVRTITAIATSPVASLLAVSGQQQVLLFNSFDHQLMNRLPFPEGDVFTLRFSRDGSLLLAGGGTGGESGRVVAFNTSTGERVFEIGDESDLVLAADLSPNGRFLAIGGPARVVRLYDTTDGRLISEIRRHTDWILHIAFSHDSLLLATADRFGTICVSEGKTGQHFMTLRGHTAAISGLEWTADSATLFSASHDGSIRARNLHTGDETQQIQPDIGRILTFARDPLGRLICGSASHRLAILDPNGTPLATASMQDEVSHIQITQDAAHVIASDATGNLAIHSLPDATQVGILNLPQPAELND
ncbi:MAG: Chromosome partition protein Smc [Planctomycetota bacterium]|jgi:hypothetical protein